jgi:uncharacterized membrane protein YraQ (UPF0718 family)
MPEMIVLRRVLKPKLLAALITVVGVGILIVGRFFNWVLQLLTMYLSPNSEEARP